MTQTESVKYVDDLEAAIHDLLFQGVKQFSVVQRDGEWHLSYPPTVDVGLGEDEAAES